MLPLLRKVRKSLMEPGSAGKYLLYAIGEILLVVIGILIALQVNTANENRQKSYQERVYLENLRDDLTLQIEMLEVYIEFETIITDHATELARHYEARGGFRDMDSLMPKLNDLTVRWTFTNANTTLKEMLSSGQINLINNRDLKKDLIAFNEQIESFANNTEINNTHLVDRLVTSHIVPNGTYASQGLSDRMMQKFGDFYLTEILRVDDPELQQIAMRRLARDEERLTMINFILFRHALANLQRLGNESIMARAKALMERIQQELDTP